MNSCESRVNYSVDTDSALSIANCFAETDFWSAHDRFSSLANGQNTAGTGTGLAMACTQAMGYNCSQNFMRAAVEVRSSGRIRLIDAPGNYEFSGFGAAAETVIVEPGVNARITVRGHSRIYFLKGKGSVDCSSVYRSCSEL